MCAAVGPLALGLIGDEIGLEASTCRSLASSATPCRPHRPTSSLRSRRADARDRAARPRGRPAERECGRGGRGARRRPRAERIAFVSDVPGVLADDVVVRASRADDADRMLGAGASRAGSCPSSWPRCAPCAAACPPRSAPPRWSREDVPDPAAAPPGSCAAHVCTRRSHHRPRRGLPRLGRPGPVVSRLRRRPRRHAPRPLHPAVTAAAHEQLERLWHMSNLYWTEPMLRLATLLSERLGGGRASSATRARRRTRRRQDRAQGDRAARIVALEGGFHGRTLGALSVTGSPPNGRASARCCRVSRLHRRTTSRPSSGNFAGRRRGTGAARACARRGRGDPARAGFARAAAEMAREVGALLCADEVQVGLGAPGRSSPSSSSVEPDLVTLAKGLANGLPAGALLARDRGAGASRPGSRLHVRRKPGHLRGRLRRRRGDRRRPPGRRSRRAGSNSPRVSRAFPAWWRYAAAAS